MMRDKVAHVRRAIKRGHTGDHTCHWPGCETRVTPAVWGCSRHWFMLPHHIQIGIWRAYKMNQEVTKRPSRQYIAAARAAQDWIREKYGEASSDS